LTTQTRIAAVLAAALIAAPAAFAPAAFAQSAETSKGHEYTVTMGNMDYAAMPSGLKVGDTIVWVNHDTVTHSVTARDHSFDLRLNPGQSGKLTLTQAGKISFYCLFHPTMRGTLNVAPK
jgi:plastocyanin